MFPHRPASWSPLVRAFLALVPLAAWLAPAGAATIQLGGAGGAGGFGNSVTLSGDGISITARGWAETGRKQADPAGFYPLEAAEVWSWPAGLGICNRTEGLADVDCDASEWEIDTVGRDDVLMLAFDRRVRFEGLEVLPLDGPGDDPDDRDIVFWVGDFAVPPDLAGHGFATLATIPGLGAGTRSPAASGFAPFGHALSGTGNLLLVAGDYATRLCKAGNVAGDAGCESFVVSTVTVSVVPVPPAAGLLGSALAALAAARRRARR